MLTVDQIIFGPFVIAMLIALIIFVIGIIYWFIYTTKRHKLHKSEKIFAEAEKDQQLKEQQALEEKYEVERRDRTEKIENLEKLKQSKNLKL
ncbi:hypothetical protein IKG48_01345 [Candidatus Saccharibacteria bacterium]|nr:hypothetical protein [Candidatus Saccharibacteria bacterium]